MYVKKPITLKIKESIEFLDRYSRYRWVKYNTFNENKKIY